MMSVSELLAKSRAAHGAYRMADAGLGDRAGKRAAKVGHLRVARDSRQKAHELDPDHTDPAWADDRTPHAVLMAFYAQQVDA